MILYAKKPTFCSSVNNLKRIMLLYVFNINNMNGKRKFPFSVKSIQEVLRDAPQLHFVSKSYSTYYDTWNHVNVCMRQSSSTLRILDPRRGPLIVENCCNNNNEREREIATKQGTPLASSENIINIQLIDDRTWQIILDHEECMIIFFMLR